MFNLDDGKPILPLGEGVVCSQTVDGSVLNDGE